MYLVVVYVHMNNQFQMVNNYYCVFCTSLASTIDPVRLKNILKCKYCYFNPKNKKIYLSLVDMYTKVCC